MPPHLIQDERLYRPMREQSSAVFIGHPGGCKASSLAEGFQGRNHLFLILLGVIGFASLLTFNPVHTNTLLINCLAKMLSITDDAGKKLLSRSLPYGLLQMIFLVVVFYLMVNLYHRSIGVYRNYQYLAAMEKEIRAAIAINEATVSFTREGSFYWNDHRLMLRAVKWVYIVLLGALLLLFLCVRVYTDFGSRKILLAIAEAVISAFTLAYFIAYACASVGLDNEKEKPILNQKLVQNKKATL